MPFGSVKVNGPPGREVYVNGDYEEAAGTTGDTFPVEYGENAFETLDTESRIDNRAVTVVDGDDPNQEVTLSPVSPPEPTTLSGG
jgi:hypothetical protein